MLHKVDTRDSTLSFVEFTLQKVDACDCTLSSAEFGLWLAPKANQGRRGPTIVITLTIYEILSCVFCCHILFEFSFQL